MLGVQGTADPYGTAGARRGGARRGPRPGQLLLLDCGHAPHLEHADVVADAVVRFLAELP